MNFAIVAAGGKGKRFGDAASKQLSLLKGRPLLSWSLGVLEGEPLIDEVILVFPRDEPEALYRAILEQEHLNKIRMIQGGETRYESVQSGFDSIQSHAGSDVVLIHDAARPLLSSALLRRVLDAAAEKGAVVPVFPVQETVKEVEESHVVRTLHREKLYVAQTPQGFRYEILRTAYERVEGTHASSLLTDEAMLVESAGFTVSVVPGENRNIKITEPEDLRLAEFYLEQ